MIQSQEYSITAPEHAVFFVLTEVVNSLGSPDVRLWGVKVSVNPSRFGTDEAFSVRLRSEKGEGEIGKILVIPWRKGSYLLKIPKHGTGGATPPELDPDGRWLDQVVERVLEKLNTEGFLSHQEAPKEKPPLGFQPRGKGHAP